MRKKESASTESSSSPAESPRKISKSRSRAANDSETNVEQMMRSTDVSKIDSAIIQDLIQRLGVASRGRVVSEREIRSSRVSGGKTGGYHDRDARFYRTTEQGLEDFDKDPHDKDPFDRDTGNFGRDNFGRDNFDRDS